jgi:hypothetical protein
MSPLVVALAELVATALVLLARELQAAAKPTTLSAAAVERILAGHVREALGALERLAERLPAGAPELADIQTQRVALEGATLPAPEEIERWALAWAALGEEEEPAQAPLRFTRAIVAGVAPAPLAGRAAARPILAGAIAVVAVASGTGCNLWDSSKYTPATSGPAFSYASCAEEGYPGDQWYYCEITGIDVCAAPQVMPCCVCAGSDLIAAAECGPPAPTSYKSIRCSSLGTDKLLRGQCSPTSAVYSPQTTCVDPTFEPVASCGTVSDGDGCIYDTDCVSCLCADGACAVSP